MRPKTRSQEASYDVQRPKNMISVLQCIVVCCSVLQCVAISCTLVCGHSMTPQHTTKLCNIHS